MEALTGRQQQVVEQAIEVIGKGGLRDLTMRRLSKRLGITEPALYRHFENKTAILSAIFAELEAETYGQLPLDENATPEALSAHFERLLTLFASRPALATVVFLDEFAAAEPDLQSRVRSLLARNHSRLAAGLSGMQFRGMSTTEIDSDSFATLLLGGIRLLVREWRLDGCNWDLVERGRRLVVALTGLLKRGDS
jgi:AcrR family transcriptional regulator